MLQLTKVNQGKKDCFLKCYSDEIRMSFNDILKETIFKM